MGQRPDIAEPTRLTLARLEAIAGSAVSVRRALERSVDLAPRMELLALGASYSVEADRAAVPGRRISSESGRNSLARYPAPDHHAWQIWVSRHNDPKLRRQV